MTKPKRLFESREIETKPLERIIMVHMAMHYECEVCGNIFKFWLEKGLEDRKQDEINPEKHKPVPFCIPCLCGGAAKHFMWGSDEELEDYRQLEENENYFENNEKQDCGIPHFRNDGYHVEQQKLEYPELSELLLQFEKNTKSRKEPKQYTHNFDDDNLYGLAHVSTSTLKAELRRRKRSWNRRTKE